MVRLHIMDALGGKPIKRIIDQIAFLVLKVWQIFKHISLRYFIKHKALYFWWVWPIIPPSLSPLYLLKIGPLFWVRPPQPDIKVEIFQGENKDSFSLTWFIVYIVPHPFPPSIAFFLRILLACLLFLTICSNFVWGMAPPIF